MDTKKSPEVWDRLSNESGRAYEAFKVYMFMSPAGRNVVGAWREWTENPEAARPSPFFENWAREFAWPERARAHDHHLELVRRRGMEKAIEEEAERQAHEVERARGRMNELMTLAYVQAAEWLENAQPADLRAQDVIKIIGLHMDYLKTFEVDRESRAEDDWTEEDDAEFEQIIKEVDALAELKYPEEAEDSGNDSDEDGGSKEGPLDQPEP
jgi:hypothetical protein